jgi:hypothetical protein
MRGQRRVKHNWIWQVKRLALNCCQCPVTFLAVSRVLHPWKLEVALNYDLLDA